MFTITQPRLTKRLFSQLVPWLFLYATAHAQTAWPRVPSRKVARPLIFPNGLQLTASAMHPSSSTTS